MYGGLFGDLPATKDCKKDGNEKDDDAEEAAATTKNESTATTARTVEEPQSSNKGPSLVQTLGSAGTSMAFVPTHINRKRKPATASTASTTIKKTPTATSAPAPSIATTELSAWKEERQQASSATVVKAKNIHDIDNSASQQTTHDAPNFHNPQNTTATESEELQNLHESVTDPYDPLVPNDLLQYWETKAAIRERQELEREARETMESQQRIRQQLEQERHELEKSGDVAKLMQLGAGAGRGRGRGRGVSNLPAWLVEKQKKEEEMRRLSS